MPIKIFSTPGDHRDDFVHLETQFNEWEAQMQPTVISMHSTANPLPTQRDVGSFMLTLVVHYQPSA
ncbi:MAG: hypothetical protein ACE5E5_06120 [Phycisphaerae bacterium]